MDLGEASNDIVFDATLVHATLDLKVTLITPGGLAIELEGEERRNTTYSPRVCNKPVVGSVLIAVADDLHCMTTEHTAALVNVNTALVVN